MQSGITFGELDLASNRAELVARAVSDAQRQILQVDRHIAENKIHISQQRAIVQRMVEACVSTELAESMLETLEENLHAFERHRKFILSRVVAVTRRAATVPPTLPSDLTKP